MMRRRRYLPGWALTVLWPAFRYSRRRDAYILRVVGERRGPVLKRDYEPHEFARKVWAIAVFTLLAAALAVLGFANWVVGHP